MKEIGVCARETCSTQMRGAGERSGMTVVANVIEEEATKRTLAVRLAVIGDPVFEEAERTPLQAGLLVSFVEISVETAKTVGV